MNDTKCDKDYIIIDNQIWFKQIAMSRSSSEASLSSLNSNRSSQNYGNNFNDIDSDSGSDENANGPSVISLSSNETREANQLPTEEVRSLNQQFPEHEFTAPSSSSSTTTNTAREIVKNFAESISAIIRSNKTKNSEICSQLNTIIIKKLFFQDNEIKRESQLSLALGKKGDSRSSLTNKWIVGSDGKIKMSTNQRGVINQIADFCLNEQQDNFEGSTTESESSNDNNSSEEISDIEREYRNNQGIIYRQANSLFHGTPEEFYEDTLKNFFADNTFRSFKIRKGTKWNIFEHSLKILFLKNNFRAIYTYEKLKKNGTKLPNISFIKSKLIKALKVKEIQNLKKLTEEQLLNKYYQYKIDLDEKDTKELDKIIELTDFVKKVIRFSDKTLIGEDKTIKEKNREEVLENLHKFDPRTLSEFINTSIMKRSNNITENYKRYLAQCARKNPSLIKSLDYTEGSVLLNEQKDAIKSIKSNGQTINDITANSIGSFPSINNTVLTDLPMKGKLPLHAFCTVENEQKVFALTLANLYAYNEVSHFIWPAEVSVACDIDRQIIQDLITNLKFDNGHNDIKEWKKIIGQREDDNEIIKNFLFHFSIMAQLVDDIGFCCPDCSGKEDKKLTPPLTQFKNSDFNLIEELNKIRTKDNQDNIGFINQTCNFLKIINKSLMNKNETNSISRNPIIEIINKNIDQWSKKLNDLDVSTATKKAKALQYCINLYDKLSAYDPDEKYFNIEKESLKKIIHHLAKITIKELEISASNEHLNVDKNKPFAFSRILLDARLILGNEIPLVIPNTYLYPKFNLSDEKEKKRIENAQRFSSDPQNDGIDTSVPLYKQLINCGPIALNIVVGDFGSGKTTVINQIRKMNEQDKKRVIISNIEFDSATKDAGESPSESALFTFTTDQEKKLLSELELDSFNVLSTEESAKNTVSECACCSGRRKLIADLIEKNRSTHAEIIYLDAAGMVDPNGVANIELEIVNGRIFFDNVITIINTDEEDYTKLYDQLEEFLNKENNNHQTFEEYLEENVEKKVISAWIRNKFSTFELATHVLLNPHSDKELNQPKIETIHKIANLKKNGEFLKKAEIPIDSQIGEQSDEEENVDEDSEIGSRTAETFIKINATKLKDVRNAIIKIEGKQTSGISDKEIRPDHAINESEVPDEIIQKNIDLSIVKQEVIIKKFIPWLIRTDFKRGKGWFNLNNRLVEFEKTPTGLHLDVSQLYYEVQKNVFSKVYNTYKDKDRPINHSNDGSIKMQDIKDKQSFSFTIKNNEFLFNENPVKGNEFIEQFRQKEKN